MDEFSKIWEISGVLRRGVGIPRSSVGPRQDVACPRQGVAERGLGQVSGTLLRCGEGLHRSVVVLRHYVATVHSV